VVAVLVMTGRCAPLIVDINDPATMVEQPNTLSGIHAEMIINIIPPPNGTVIWERVRNGTWRRKAMMGGPLQTLYDICGRSLRVHNIYQVELLLQLQIGSFTALQCRSH
jgi:hypothetical protein